MQEDLIYQNIILNHLNAPEDKLLTAQVDELRRQSAEHETYFQEIKRLWSASAETKYLNEIAVVNSVKGFRSRLSEHRITPQANGYYWLKGIAAAITISIIGLWLYSRKEPVNYLVKRTSNTIDSLVLQDGTKIMMAKNTAIRYPTKFVSTREITLQHGEAFFDVHPNANHPFKITIGKSVVSVVGTSFNIQYTPIFINLAVKTGKVTFQPNEVSMASVVIAGQALEYNLEKQEMNRVDGANANSWITNELVFVDMPLEDVCKALSDYYEVDIVVHNKKNNAMKFNAKFKGSSLDEVLSVLKQTYNIKIEVSNQVIIITNL